MTDQYAYMLVKAVLTLAFVLGLIGASLYALRYWMKKSGQAGLEKRRAPVKVLNTAFLGNKKNISIVEVAGKILVLGITPTTITYLTKIDDPAACEELKASKGAGAGSLFGFLNNG